MSEMTATMLAQGVRMSQQWAAAEKIVDGNGDEICAFRCDRPSEPIAVGIDDDALVWLTPSQAQQLIEQIQAAMR